LSVLVIELLLVAGVRHVLPVAAEGVLLLGGRPRFSLRKLLSRA
jgi:hypothetical protein